MSGTGLIIMTRLRTTIVIALVCLAGGAAAYLYKEGSVTPEYSSSTRFRILEQSVPGGEETGKADAATKESWLAGEVALLESPEILTRVVKALGLDAEWKLTPEQAVARAKEKLEISADATGEIVTVTGWAESANGAASLANAVRNAYGQYRTDAQYAKLAQAVKDIEKRTAEQQRRVDADRAELEAVIKRQGIEAGLPEVSGAGKAAADPTK